MQVIGNTKRAQLLTLLADGRNHNITVLSNKLGSPVHALRGRISELRNRGFEITHAEGRVRLVGVRV